MMYRIAALVLAASFIHGETRAAEWYLDFAYATGGDDLAEVELEYEDGDTSSEDITAGGGFSLAFGLSQPFTELFAVQAAYGYKEHAVRADNGSSSFKRMTLDVLAVLTPGDWRIGAGFTKEMDPKLHVKYGIADYGFDDATGTVVEVGYHFSESFAVALRRTMIEYDVTIGIPDYGSFEGTIDGNNWGIRAEFLF
ncbi:MAG: hypothetical protein ACK4E7_07890 [Permianibacter sp.]